MARALAPPPPGREVLKLRRACIGHYGGLPMFRHDQTKVGNYDAAIRIPERLYDVLAERQRKPWTCSPPSRCSNSSRRKR